MANYARAGLFDWRANLPTIALVFVGAAVGGFAVQQIDSTSSTC
jgi:uncharacterized membrane protein YfcA